MSRKGRLEKEVPLKKDRMLKFIGYILQPTSISLFLYESSEEMIKIS